MASTSTSTQYYGSFEPFIFFTSFIPFLIHCDWHSDDSASSTLPTQRFDVISRSSEYVWRWPNLNALMCDVIALNVEHRQCRWPSSIFFPIFYYGRNWVQHKLDIRMWFNRCQCCLPQMIGLSLREIYTPRKICGTLNWNDRFWCSLIYDTMAGPAKKNNVIVSKICNILRLRFFACMKKIDQCNLILDIIFSRSSSDGKSSKRERRKNMRVCIYICMSNILISYDLRMAVRCLCSLRV